MKDNKHKLHEKQYSTYSNAVRSVKNFDKKNNTKTEFCVNKLDDGCHEIIVIKKNKHNENTNHSS